MEIILLVAQLALTAGGFALLWRRLDAMAADVLRLREAVEALEARKLAPQRAQQRAAVSATSTLAQTATETPHVRAARAWRLPAASTRHAEAAPPRVPVSTLQAAMLTAFGLAPLLGFFLGASAGAVVVTGLVFAAAMIAAASHPHWRLAAWASVISAALWAIAGFALPATPLLFAAGLGVVGVAGIVQAWLRHPAPGGALVLVAATATLVLANHIGVASPAGAAFAAIAIGAALVGATALRLEVFHLAGFGAALLGLFVLSGQTEAAVWFTPAAAWAGSLFLGIAAVRVPQLGARGVTLAGTGVVAPFGVIAALYGAQHALESRFAAAAAFVAFALAAALILYLAARRRERGLEALGLTLWLLAMGAACAFAAAVFVALPAPLAATAFASATLTLMAIDKRSPHGAWRLLACCAAALASIFAFVTIGLFLNEARPWPAWTLIVGGLALPAALIGAGAYFARRASTPALHVGFGILALAFLIGALHLATRLAFAGEALMLRPMSFPEAGAHISIWLSGALLAAANARGGPRIAASMTLAVAALGASALASVLWLSPFWTNRADADGLPAPLGFWAPALMFGVHWAFWRARGSNLRTRVAFAAGVVLTAAGATLWLSESDGVPEWVGALAGAFAFAGAIVMNFASGVTQSEHRQSYLRERRLSA